MLFLVMMTSQLFTSEGSVQFSLTTYQHDVCDPQIRPLLVVDITSLSYQKKTHTSALFVSIRGHLIFNTIYDNARTLRKTFLYFSLKEQKTSLYLTYFLRWNIKWNCSEVHFSVSLNTRQDKKYSYKTNTFQHFKLVILNYYKSDKAVWILL